MLIYSLQVCKKSVNRRNFANMAKVHVQNVVVLDNPSNFSNPFQFEITFECLEDLQEVLAIYIHSIIIIILIIFLMMRIWSGKLYMLVQVLYTYNIYLKLYHTLFSFPAESETYDQVLDTVYVGPVPEGRHMFVFQAEPPQPSKIPVADAVGVTVVLLTCSYRSQEFIRVG